MKDQEDDTPVERSAGREFGHSLRRIVLSLGVLLVMYSYFSHSSGPRTSLKDKMRERKEATQTEEQAKPAAQDTASPTSIASSAPEPIGDEKKPAEITKDEQAAATEDKEQAAPEKPDAENPAPEKPTPEKLTEESTPAQLEKAPAPGPSNEKMAQLEQKLAEQEQRLAALTSELMELSATRGELEQRVSGQQRELAAITLLSQLSQALTSGTPFRPVIEELRRLYPGEAAAAAFAPLEANAASGIPTLSQLQGGFASAASKTLSESSGSRWQMQLSKVIRIRKVGEHHEGMDDESVLARAEAQLSASQIEKSLATLEALSPTAKTLMDAWMTQARTHAAAMAALARLERLERSPVLSSAPALSYTPIPEGSSAP